jgi:hypothetical protein
VFDFTIDIQEREGSPTGHKSRFLARQRIPRNFHNLDDIKATADDAFLSLDDLVIGAHVGIFGKSIFLYDCDEFTRRYHITLCVFVCVSTGTNMRVPSL